MKSKLISPNMVTFEMFIFRLISTLVNREDSPTLSKTYLSGPIYFVSGPPGLSQDYLRTISGFSGPHSGSNASLQDPRIFRTSGAGQDGYTPALSLLPGIHGHFVFPYP